jgi:hypothetical protein
MKIMNTPIRVPQGKQKGIAPIAIILIVVGVLVVGGGGYYFLQNTGTLNGQIGEPAKCTKIDNTINRITCAVDAARKNNDVRFCNSKFTPVRYQCYAIYAEHTQDAFLCDAIPTNEEFGEPAEIMVDIQGIIDICKLDVVKAKDNIKEDTAICGTIKGIFLKDECYEAVAQGTGDISICENIERNMSIKDRCYGRPTFVE